MAANNTMGTVYGIFLSSLDCFVCPADMSKNHTSGDLIFCTKTATSVPEPAIVLGFAATRREAKSMANNYLQEVGRIHGVSDVEEVTLGETQMFE